MRQLLIVEVGDRYVIVPKLIGAMLIAISIIMLLGATVDIFQTRDRIKDVYDKCLGSFLSIPTDSEIATELRYQTCVLKGIAAGVYVYSPDDGLVEARAMEEWDLMLPKVAAWLFWALVLIVAILMYQTGKTIFQPAKVVGEVKRSAEKKGAEEATVRKEKVTKRKRSRKKR